MSARAQQQEQFVGGGSGGGKSGGSFSYWSMWRQDEPQAKVIQAAISQFTADTGVKVNVEWTGRDVAKKIGPAMAAGKAPDMWTRAPTSSTALRRRTATPRTSRRSWA